MTWKYLRRSSCSTGPSLLPTTISLLFDVCHWNHFGKQQQILRSHHSLCPSFKTIDAPFDIHNIKIMLFIRRKNTHTTSKSICNRAIYGNHSSEMEQNVWLRWLNIYTHGSCLTYIDIHFFATLFFLLPTDGAYLWREKEFPIKTCTTTHKKTKS